MSRRPLGLTARLALIAAALVAATTLLIAAGTTLAMRDYLTEQLDKDVRAALLRGPGSPDDHRSPEDDQRQSPGPDDPAADNPFVDGQPGDVRGQAEGTLTATIDGSSLSGIVIEPSSDGPAVAAQLDSDVLHALADVPTDRTGHTVALPGLGDYRLIAEQLPDGRLAIAGLPARTANDPLSRLVSLELLAGLVGVGAAGFAGWVVVRRQLAPLREVAHTAYEVSGLELATGEVALAPRVPARLTDDRTEVGQVGSALNRLIDHIESALAERHRSEQQVRQFVADASHELRTPLTAIAGYAQLAHDERTGRDARSGALDKIAVAAERMGTLVEDLLLLARLDQGRPLAQQPVDLTHLLLDAVEDARVLSPEHEWRLSLPTSAVDVIGDEARLHQVVSNLLVNARRHTPPGTSVEIRLRREGAGGAVIEVRDDGPGFSRELLETAFERFSRGDSARTRDAHPGGAGLGLSLAKAIVAAQGGTITLASKPGQTVFTITLP